MDTESTALNKMALGVAYNGFGFNGWQTQANRNTIQDVLEAALSEFANQPIQTICAGRTDTGVHALAQVVHFQTSSQRRLESWVRGVNAKLPSSIRVRWAQPVSSEFHARFDASSRSYIYVLRNERALAPAWVGKCGWDFHPLNIEAMQQAAQHLIGCHDFTSFRSSICQAHSPVRTLHQLQIEQHGVFIVFVLQANAFLHHMVRNIIGSLVYVGKGRFDSDWLAELLASKNRQFAAPTFMSDGLYLVDVQYPPHYALKRYQTFDHQAAFESWLQAI